MVTQAAWRRGLGERREVEVLEAARHGFEARARQRVGQHVDHRAAGEEARGDHLVVAPMRLEFALADALAPDPAVHRLDQLERRAGADDAAGGDDRHARAQVGDVLDDVRRQDHDHVLADLGQQVEEAVALLGVEAGGGLVDDDQLRLAEQRLRDAEALAHAAGEAGQRLLAHVPEVDLLQQRLDGLLAFACGWRSPSGSPGDRACPAPRPAGTRRNPAAGSRACGAAPRGWPARRCRRSGSNPASESAAWRCSASARTCRRRWGRAARTCRAATSSVTASSARVPLG